jgi:isopenicillin-N epimerase
MPSPYAAGWTLEPGLDFLNHGSFGATPRVVLDSQNMWRTRMEAEPVQFFARDLEGLLDDVRSQLAVFLGASAGDLAFVPNVTAGFNAVLRALSFEPGDELLMTDHAYNAAKTTLEYVAQRSEARVVMASVPFPLSDSSQVVDAILAAVTSRTRLAVIDHISSPTALIFPIARLVTELDARGVDTLVDGAHAPGMVDLDLKRLGAAYYTGNLHKWVCAPKGSGFLWVRSDRRDAIRPVAISHGANSPRLDRSRFHLEFDWTGTADPSPYLAVPAALEFGSTLLPGGWPAVQARNHELALAARDLLCEVVNAEAPAPADMVGSMVSVPLAENAPGTYVPGIELYGDPIHDALLERGIQVVVAPWPQRPNGRAWRRLIRVSAAAYNDRDQMERLAATLREILAVPA